MCTGNTHAAPIGNADPVLSAGAGNVACGTGYKDKANKAAIVGTDVASCCDAKTCADLWCGAGKKAKPSPTQPAAGNEPSVADCCEDITSMCRGPGDIACPTGYKDKANKAAIAGTDVASCCDAKTCADLSCAASGKRAKPSPTQPEAGNEPSVADCCEDITGMCSGNTGGTGDVACGTGYKDKANKAAIVGIDISRCCDHTQLCTGNPGGDGDVSCPSFFSNKGSLFSYVIATDTTTAQKYSKCCMQPKCTANVQGVSPTCSAVAVAMVHGTCGFGYTEKANISNLPADPTDWSSFPVAKTVTPGSNQLECCTPISGMCVGNADGARVVCGTGYKYKFNPHSIMGADVAACCDAKTCADLSCVSWRQRAKPSPTQPTAGNEPSFTDCCEDITGMCSGNTATGDVACGTGYKDKADKSAIAGTNVTACCDAKTCADLPPLSCLYWGRRAKPSPTQLAAGNEPSATDCCEDITGMCSGNTGRVGDVVCNSPNYTDKANKASIQGTDVAACCDPIIGSCLSYTAAGVRYPCPANMWSYEDISRVEPLPCVLAVDCVNDAFDRAAITPRLGYGPTCPDPTAQIAAEAACTATGGGGGGGGGEGAGAGGGGGGGGGGGSSNINSTSNASLAVPGGGGGSSNINSTSNASLAVPGGGGGSSNINTTSTAGLAVPGGGGGSSNINTTSTAGLAVPGTASLAVPGSGASRVILALAGVAAAVTFSFNP